MKVGVPSEIKAQESELDYTKKCSRTNQSWS